ncbi:ATP-dependent DNA helicase [Rhizoctonia solani AG-1 IA]|uniref:DNA 3'-5' helicase n=1 Tax=Thanatephorus cucumeris (strain AG1-IA) TaxID=983506 RepID=L8WN31_THACA|nr:ATP-dependent DNA helicase [Rhizoctonia solani AG-1 IA]
MDGRDVVCVMPTGGGKSLTYQLPALVLPGCTLVISPLVALIMDQVMHLRENGIEAVMLTGATKKEESRSIMQRLAQAGKSKGIVAADMVGSSREKPIKLCYVTVGEPEKIAKSKTFTSTLEKMCTAGQLARIVIDEAHCVSQLGHDFRPDYKKLSILRQLFPNVPITALSATCPPKVLKDLLVTLRMRQVTDGNSKNLHYSVLPKPASAAGAIQVMADYITQNHAGHSGIVYCLSKKDTETVAEGLSSCSKGAIRTGVYHADIGDYEKESLHIRWRNGEVQVVCATIESGRAGRDGNDSDCVLYYRGQDATSYFSASSSLSLSSWTTEAGGKLTPCGHCDNCTRPPESVASKDVTLDAWIILRVAQTIDGEGGRVTIGMLADLVRGVGGKSFQVPAGGGKGRKRKSQGEKVGLDLDGIAGGKISLSKDVCISVIEIFALLTCSFCQDAEALIIQLVLSGHLKEIFHSTAYAINVYLQLGPQAVRLTRLDRESVEAGSGPKIECTFIQRTSGRSKAAPKKQAGKSNVGGRKGKSKATISDEDDGEDEQVEDLTEQIRQDVASADSDDLEDADEEGWSYSMMPRRKNGQGTGPSVSNSARKRRKIVSDEDSDDDVIILSE